MTMPLPNLNVKLIQEMSDGEIFLLFKGFRWQHCTPYDLNDAECPHCRCRNVKFYPKSEDKNHWQNKSGNRWRCRNKGCRKYFSLTSGTAFASHKLSLRTILIFLVTWGANISSKPTTEIARLLGITQKNAYLFKMKIGEVLLQTQDFTPMKDLVQIDGCYHVLSLRFKEFLPKEAFMEERQKKKEATRCILIACQASNDKRIKGSNRTMFTIIRTERTDEILPFAHKLILPQTEIWTDKHLAYKALDYQYEHKSVNHSKEFKSKEGVHNNWCESVNSRIRKALKALHRVSNLYLPYYVAEIIYKTDNRHSKLRKTVTDICQRFFSLKPLKDWTNYQYGNRPKKERLGMELISHFEEMQHTRLNQALHCQ